MTNRAIALAGIFQAIHLVDALAYAKDSNPHDIKTSLNSIFIMNPEDFISVYSNVAHLRTGIQSAIEHLEGKQNAYAFRYALNLVFLQRKMAKNSEKMDQIGHQISSLHRQDLAVDSLENIEALAKIYRTHISEIKPAIMVQGDPQTLKQPLVVEKVRALLLAGIRAASLWNSAGTGKLTLLLSRKKIVKELKDLL